MQVPRLSLLLAWLACGLSIVFAEEKPKLRESSDATTSQRKPLGADEARRQAEVLKTTINSTLRLVHDRYYREDEGLPIPAATLKDIFKDLERQHHIKLRWLAVEGQAMNTDHKPRTDFERHSVDALKGDRPFHEEISNGTFRRAMPITLTNHCLKCHVPDRRTLEDRTAGLIVEMAVLP